MKVGAPLLKSGLWMKQSAFIFSGQDRSESNRHNVAANWVG